MRWDAEEHRTLHVRMAEDVCFGCDSSPKILAAKKGSKKRLRIHSLNILLQAVNILQLTVLHDSAKRLGTYKKRKIGRPGTKKNKGAKRLC
jgi:hypothetical protein